jgi:hypothetical protein
MTTESFVIVSSVFVSNAHSHLLARKREGTQLPTLSRELMQPLLMLILSEILEKFAFRWKNEMRLFKRFRLKTRQEKYFFSFCHAISILDSLLTFNP